MNSVSMEIMLMLSDWHTMAIYILYNMHDCINNTACMHNHIYIYTCMHVMLIDYIILELRFTFH